MDDAAVRLPVATGNERRALGQLVLAHLAVEHQLVQGRLDHGQGRRQLFEVDEPASGIVGRGQEGGRRPARAVVGAAPRDAAEIDGIEQQTPGRPRLPVGGRGHLLGHLALRGPWRPPDNRRLARLNQQREHLGEFARAERVVRGDFLGNRHGVTSVRREIGAARTLSRTVRPRPAHRGPRALQALGLIKWLAGGVARQGREWRSFGIPIACSSPNRIGGILLANLRPGRTILRDAERAPRRLNVTARADQKRGNEKGYGPENRRKETDRSIE